MCSALVVATALGPATGASAGSVLLGVVVAPAGPGPRVRIVASGVLQFAIRQVPSANQVVVDLPGVSLGRLPRVQVVSLPPLRAVRLVSEGGLSRVLIELSAPALFDLATSPDARSLSLTFRAAPAQAARPSPAAATGGKEAGAGDQAAAIVLKHLPAAEAAPRIQALFPALVVKAEPARNAVLLRGPPALVAQAREVLAALDVPAPTQRGTEIVRLQQAQAADLLPTLRRAFPEARLSVDPRLNALVVSATPAVLAALKAVVQTLDVAPAADPSKPATEIVPLRQAKAMSVAASLRGLVPGLLVRVEEPANALILQGPPALIAQAKTLIAQLDVQAQTAIVTDIVRLRYVQAAEVQKSLQNAAPALVILADPGVNALILRGPAAEVVKAKALLAGLDVQPLAPPPTALRAELIPLKYALPSDFLSDTQTSRSAEDLAQTLQTALQPAYPELRITPDRKTQSLIVVGTQPAIDAVRGLLERLDQPSPQVILEARVLEVAQGTLQNLGITLSPIVSIGFTEKGTEPPAAFTFGRTPISFSILLNLLSEKGKARILANPAVATIDGRKATIRAGDDIPIVIRQSFGNTIIENVIVFRSGITLEITPKISPAKAITVILKPTVSTITGTTPSGTPQISTREVSTTVQLLDGETVIIGGLLEDRMVETVSKIPGLGDLPVLGRLFQSVRRDARRTELIVTVTPRIFTLGQPPAPAPQEDQKP